MCDVRVSESKKTVKDKARQCEVISLYGLMLQCLSKTQLDITRLHAFVFLWCTILPDCVLACDEMNENWMYCACKSVCQGLCLFMCPSSDCYSPLIACGERSLINFKCCSWSFDKQPNNYLHICACPTHFTLGCNHKAIAYNSVIALNS